MILFRKKTFIKENTWIDYGENCLEVEHTFGPAVLNTEMEFKKLSDGDGVTWIKIDSAMEDLSKIGM